METHKGIVPLTTYLEHARDYDTHRVPEISNRLYIMLRELQERALLPQIHHAMNGVESGLNVVREVSTEVFGTPLDDYELEEVINAYTFVFTRLTGYNGGDVEDEEMDNSVGEFNESLFFQIHGPANEYPVTVDHVADFVIENHNLMHDWTEMLGDIEQYRASFCKDLQKLVDADLIDEDMLPSLVYLARTVDLSGIRPVDFMSNVMNSINIPSLSNNAAYYSWVTHSALVNLSEAGGATKPKTLRAVTKSTVYHELIHSLTGCWAVLRDGDTPERPDYFPNFIQEATAEILAFVMLDDSDIKRITKLVDTQYVETKSLYGDYRQVFFGDRPGRMTAYAEYRFMLDMMMAKLDWEAAGIDQIEAEKLLCRALFDGPSKINEVDKSCPHIRAFHSALTEASFPGFMVHLREIGDHESFAMLLNYFDSPSFDPHDKESLPRTLTTKLYEWNENYSDNPLRDRRPNTQLLMDYAKRHFIYNHGQRVYQFSAKVEEEGNVEVVNTERQYGIHQEPTRFLALKALMRATMDKRATERSAVMRRRWFEQKREEAARYQKTPT